MTNTRWLTAFALAAILATLMGCSRTQVAAPASSALPRNDSYVDLEAGWTLRIVVPLMKSGALRPDLRSESTNGNTLTLSANDLLGYTTSQYAVIGHANKVRLTFVSAEESREGKSSPAAGAPPLPFELPRKSERIRLVYLVRVSRADHNMAVVAAKRLDALDAFTNRLKEDPSLCRSDAQIFCSWVPAGVAVRTETNEPSSPPGAGQ